MERNREAEYRIGVSDLSGSLGSAIRTKGCLLLFCLQGRAIVSANLERRVFRRGDIAVIFPDTLFKAAEFDKLITHHVRIRCQSLPNFINGIRRHILPILLM